MTRRTDLTSAAAAASGQRAHAAADQVVKVAWISPQTGFLSSFGVTDQYAAQLLTPRLAAGLDGNGGKRRIEVTLHDAQSSTSKAQSLARELIAAGTHLILATATPEIVNPVSDVCEGAGVPCISSIVPWQAWFNARGGDPIKGFRWTYHFFAGLEDFADVYSSLQAGAMLGDKTGGLFGDDIDADAFLKAFPPAFARRGIELVVPQRVSLARPDWETVAIKLRDARVRMVTGVLPPPVGFRVPEHRVRGLPAGLDAHQRGLVVARLAVPIQPDRQHRHPPYPRQHGGRAHQLAGPTPQSERLHDARRRRPVAEGPA